MVKNRCFWLVRSTLDGVGRVPDQAQPSGGTPLCLCLSVTIDHLRICFS
jgi:hypothetical protein